MLAKTTSFRRLIAAMHPDEAVLVGGNAIPLLAGGEEKGRTCKPGAP